MIHCGSRMLLYLGQTVQAADSRGSEAQHAEACAEQEAPQAGTHLGRWSSQVDDKTLRLTVYQQPRCCSSMLSSLGWSPASGDHPPMSAQTPRKLWWLQGLHMQRFGVDQ